MRYYLHYSIPVLQQALPLWGVLLLVALPWLLACHHRRSRRVSLKDLAFTALVTLYGAGVLAFTFLPLPASGELVCSPGTNYPRWFLGWSFQFALQANDGLLGALFSMYVLQMALNILLFVPFGAIARARWAVGFTLLLYAAFGSSLLIELTQLTGLWGLYDCAVRTFDAEDLFNNTLGAVVGWGCLATWQHRRQLGSYLRLLRGR